MPDKPKISTVFITLPIMFLNSIIEQGSVMSVDRVSGHIARGDIFPVLNTIAGVDLSFMLQPNGEADVQELLEALRRVRDATVASDFRVSSGLPYLLAMLNQLIQQNVDEVELG